MTDSNSMSRSRFLQALLTSTALVSVGTSQAQTDPSSREPGSDVIEEVVVRGVARRFRPDEQSSATGLNLSLVETPQSVTVITPEMMETIGAHSAYEATDLVPNVQRSGFGFGLQQVVMRGVFNLSRRVNGLELDNQVASIRSYATERLEVVRGPATAIYGVTGAFGGEINSILKTPRSNFGMEFGVEYGSYDSSQYTFDVTGPLAGDGSVSGRLVGLYEEYDLPLDIKGQSFPNYQSMGLASLAWDPTDRTTLRATFYHQERNVDPWDGGALIDNGDGTLSLPDVDPETWYFSHPDQSTEKTEWNVAFVELEHEFDNGMYATTKVMYDEFSHDLEYFYPFGSFGAYALGDDEVYIYSYDIEESGERLTFSQSLGGNFELGGREHEFFAAVEYNDDQEPNRFELLNSFFQGYAAIDWYTDAVFDGQTPRFTDGSPFLPIQGDREEQFGVAKLELQEAKDLKLSLQLLLKPTDKLQLLLGALYHDNETVDTVPIVSGAAIVPPRVTETDFQEAVFRFGATYDVADYRGFVDDARIYYSFTEGFEPQILIDADGNGLSAPQDMEQHEIGIKAELFEGAVGTSLAIFDYEITNIAVFNSFLGGFGGFGRFVLAGTQEATGAEFEITGEVLPGWNMSANYAYMDADILDPNNVLPTAPRTTPEHSGAVMSTYEFLQGPLEGLRLGGLLKFSGDYTFATAQNQERLGIVPKDGSHTRFDLNASYAPRSGRLEGFDFYLNWINVFDEDIIVSKQGHPGFGIMFIDQQKVTAGLRYNFE
jgi:outer-membrane receptor for ferric coprogen and ferric-rhodotorulic acid